MLFFAAVSTLLGSQSEHNDMLTAPFRAIPQLRCMVRYVALGMMHNEIAQLGTSPSGP